jgi:hypothetical protein
LFRKDGNGSKSLLMRSYKFVVLFEIGGKYRFLDPKSAGNRAIRRETPRGLYDPKVSGESVVFVIERR